MEEVNDGGGAAEVSDEEGWVMERGALNAGGLWEKRARYTVEEEEEEHEKQGGWGGGGARRETHRVSVWRSRRKRVGEVSLH